MYTTLLDVIMEVCSSFLQEHVVVRFGRDVVSLSGGTSVVNACASNNVHTHTGTPRCDPTDFLMLVCDGISEGDFPNREVVRLAANELKASGDTPDLAAASVSVCRKVLYVLWRVNRSCFA